MIWVVTVHDQYYPCSGDTDWLFVSSSEAKARKFFDDLSLEHMQSAYLIMLAVDPRTELGASVEVDCKEAED